MRKPVEGRRFVAVDSDLRDKHFEKSLFLLWSPALDCFAKGVVNVH
jgi:hypothetical protein